MAYIHTGRACTRGSVEDLVRLCLLLCQLCAWQKVSSSADGVAAKSLGAASRVLVYTSRKGQHTKQNKSNRDWPARLRQPHDLHSTLPMPTPQTQLHRTTVATTKTMTTKQPLPITKTIKTLHYRNWNDITLWSFNTHARTHACMDARTSRIAL